MDEMIEAKRAGSAGRSVVARLIRPHRRVRVVLDGASGTSRRSFLRASGGYATGVAAIVGVPAVLLEADADAATPVARTVPNPTSPVPDGPVMAYVHDAKKGTVVIMSGTSERSVQDHALVAKLLHPPKKTKAKHKRRPARTTTSKKGG